MEYSTTRNCKACKRDYEGLLSFCPKCRLLKARGKKGSEGFKELVSAKKAYKKDQRERKREKQKEYQRNYRATPQYRFRAMFGTIKARAKRKGRDCDITFEFLSSMGDCYYCGDIPTGLDRVDNDKGYLQSNCVPCCKICNQMKWGETRENFLGKVKMIAMHRKLL